MSCALCTTELPSAPGLLTCWRDRDRLRDSLDPAYRGDLAEGIPGSIPYLYGLLSPHKPGTVEETGRRPPGFAAAVPIDTQAVSLADPRSRVNGRAWTDRADRWHWEESPEQAPIHAGNSLDGWVRTVADGIRADRPRVPDTRPKASDYVGPQTRREHDIAGMPLPPDLRVPVLAAFLARHIDYVCAQGWVDESAAELWQLHQQLRTATAHLTGESRPKWVGRCAQPALDTEPDPKIDPAVDPLQGRPRCDTPLYSPRTGSTIRCRGCGAYWEQRDWLFLGDALRDAATLAGLAS